MGLIIFLLFSLIIFCLACVVVVFVATAIVQDKERSKDVY